MTISLKANAAGTQGEILLNGNPVQTINANLTQFSGQVESQAIGFKFPDGSVQAAAATPDDYLESTEVTPAAAVATVNDVAKTITSLLLPAGTWDVSACGGCGTFNLLTEFKMALSLVNNTLPASSSKILTVRAQAVGTIVGLFGGAVPQQRFTFAVPTTVYLVAWGYSGAGSGYGQISAKKAA